MDDSELTEAVTRAQQLIVNGDGVGALTLYAALWEQARAADDQYGACVVAHFMAHAQPTADAQLDWHRRALDAASAAHDERVSPFYPSLYANLAEVLLRLGNLPQARQYADLARGVADRLASDGYGRMVGALIARVSQATQAS